MLQPKLLLTVFQGCYKICYAVQVQVWCADFAIHSSPKPQEGASVTGHTGKHYECIVYVFLISQNFVDD